MINKFEKLVKIRMPNGKIVDILDDVGMILKEHIQKDISAEAGGVLIGYTHKTKENVVIEEITKPQEDDERTFLGFFRKSNNHLKTVKQAKLRKSGYLGNWHSHPSDYPEPSSTDFYSWKDSLKTEKTSCGYIFFIILGKQGYRIWIGDPNTGEIKETSEYIE